MKVFCEGIKEPLRLFVLAIVPGLLAYFGAIDAQWAVVLVFLLRFVDSYLHELGEAKKDTSLELGLTRF